MNPLKKIGALVIAVAALAPALALADYPDRPIKLVVPFLAGSAGDILGRLYADKLKSQVGQQVVVDNKPGATGAIGSDAVAKSPGDGYTLLLNSTAMLINPWIVKQPFDFMKDLTPVARAAETAFVMVVDAKSPYQTLDQLINAAKKEPGKVNCATYGIGSPPHLGLELLKQAAGVNLVHVPYKGFSQELPDLVSGQLNCAFALPIEVEQFVKNGTVRAIAVTGDGPMAMFPGAEAFGKRYPGTSVVGWQGVFAPSSTPKPVLDRLRTEWAKVLSSPEVVQKIREAGYQPSTSTVDAWTKEIASDYDKFGRIVKATGIRVE